MPEVSRSEVSNEEIRRRVGYILADKWRMTVHLKDGILDCE